MTLLFLVLLATKGRVDFGIETPEAAPVEQRPSPFVIVVVSTTGEPLLSGEEHGGWRIGGALDLESPPGIGPLHASLYARRLPPPETSIQIAGLNREASPRVQVLSAGRRIRVFTPQITGGGEPIRLWPSTRPDGSPEGQQ